jgi:hypothetical protein
MTLATTWLTFFETILQGLFASAILGLPAAVFLGAGLGLWGRKYLDVISGIFLIGIGIQVALMSGAIAAMLKGYMGDLVPSDFDSATTRSMMHGSAISAVLFLGAGGTLLAPPLARLVRGRNSRTQPVFVWVVLAWQAYSFVSVIVAMATFANKTVPLPTEMQAYIDERWPFGWLLSVGVAITQLVGAILLVRRRRVALWVFAVALIATIVGSVALGGFDPPPSQSMIFWILMSVFGFGVQLVILGYVWWLARRGVLK